MSSTVSNRRKSRIRAPKGKESNNDDGTQVDNNSVRKGKGKGKAGTKKKARAANTDTPAPLGKPQLRDFVLNTCKTGLAGLTAEFNEIKAQTQAIGNTPKSAFDANPTKNRYKDVYCVDEDRVVLTYPPGTNDYIHANYVNIPDGRKYICTQGPIATTIDDFWRMIWQEKCRSIVMLCNICEKGKKKCEQYWPENIGQEQTNGTLTVKSVEKSEFEKVMTVTKITMSDGKDNHELEHIQWNNWPDRGIPQNAVTCFELLRKLRRLSPTVIHCSAGIGRTGSIVCLDVILVRLMKGETGVTLKQSVLDLRSKRHGSVQMDIQYIFIARALAGLAIQRGAVKEDEVKEFITTYDEHCTAKGFFS